MVSFSNWHQGQQRKDNQASPVRKGRGPFSPLALVSDGQLNRLSVVLILWSFFVSFQFLYDTLFKVLFQGYFKSWPYIVFVFLLPIARLW